MKLNCGPSASERRELREQRAKKIWEEGEIVFAWLPRRVGVGDCRWFEKIIRRPDIKSYNTLSDFVFSYKWKYDVDWKYETIQRE